MTSINAKFEAFAAANKFNKVEPKWCYPEKVLPLFHGSKLRKKKSTSYKVGY